MIWLAGWCGGGVGVEIGVGRLPVWPCVCLERGG